MEKEEEEERWGEKLRVVSFNVGLRGLRMLALRSGVERIALGDSHGVVRRAGYGGLGNLVRAVDGRGDEERASDEEDTRVVVCFQEVKQSRAQLTPDIAICDGYDSFFHCGDSGYAGVATFVSDNAGGGGDVQSTSGVLGLRKLAGIDDEDVDGVCDTLSVGGNDREDGAEENVGADADKAVRVAAALAELDKEGRCLTVDIGEALIVNVYAPASGANGERSRYKACYISAVLHAARVLEERLARVVIVAGDLNVAYNHRDVTADVLWQVCGGDGVESKESAWRRIAPAQRCMNSAIDAGDVVDCFRLLHPHWTEQYSCWNVAAGMQLTNYGSRIDHILLVGGPRHVAHGDREKDPGGEHQFTAPVTAATRRRTFSERFTEVVRVEACDYMRHVDGSDHSPMFCVCRLIKGHGTAQPAHTREQFKVSSSRVIFERNQQSMKSFLVSASVLAAAGEDEETAAYAKRDALCAGLRDHEARTEKKKKKKGAAQDEGERGPRQTSLKSFFGRTEAGSQPTHRGGEEGAEERAAELPSQATARWWFDGADENVASASAGALASTSPYMQEEEAARQLEHSMAKRAWQTLHSKMASSIPRCRFHGEPCKIRRVKKKESANFGRTFYCCGRPGGAKDDPETDCGFFQWATSVRQNRDANSR